MQACDAPTLCLTCVIVVFMRLDFLSAIRIRGAELISPTVVTQQRDISFNESAVLAKEAEETLLWRDMQSDIVQQLMRRVASVKSLTTTSP